MIDTDHLAATCRIRSHRSRSLIVQSPQHNITKILMAAGGTGGHIYPALALGEALHELARIDRAGDLGGVGRVLDIRYCCGNRSGEVAIYKSAGIEPIILPLSGRRGGWGGTCQFLREYLVAQRRIYRFVKGWRPDLAIGFGNYISAPAILAAGIRGIPTVIHEQNARPGLANRALAGRAKLIFTGIPVPEGGFLPHPTLTARLHFVGNPVRRELLKPIDRAEARRNLGLPAEGLVCLCFGGSLGAQNVNRMLMEAIPLVLANRIESPEKICDDPSATNAWHFLWGTGRQLVEACGQWLDRNSGVASRVTLKAYLERMDWAYAAADLVVARAGALTLAEITALGKPSILIPLPRSAGDHQRGNARALEQAGAAVVIEEGEANSSHKLAEAIQDLCRNRDKLIQMGEAARKLGKPDAAGEMARMILAKAEG